MNNTTNTTIDQSVSGLYDEAIESLSNEAIESLSNEAGSAGDQAMVDTCTQALAGDVEAIEECERVISYARMRAAE